MHELSVCNALIAQVRRVAREHGAGKVARIVLQIGPLSGIEPGLLRRAYPLAAAATIAAHAELVIETADVVVRCRRCEAESTVAQNRMLCSACGDIQTRVISGDEMILKSVELENCSSVDDESRGARTRGMSAAR